MYATKLLSVSQQDLEAAFLEWEQERRSGELLSIAETDAMTAEQVARMSAACFFNRLESITEPV